MSCPTKLMTLVNSRPELTYRMTVSPFFSVSPASGSVRMTLPELIVSEGSSTVRISRSYRAFRSFSITFSAFRASSFTRFGMTPVSSPVLTVT